MDLIDPTTPLKIEAAPFINMLPAALTPLTTAPPTALAPETIEFPTLDKSDKAADPMFLAPVAIADPTFEAADPIADPTSETPEAIDDPTDLAAFQTDPKNPFIKAFLALYDFICMKNLLLLALLLVLLDNQEIIVPLTLQARLIPLDKTSLIVLKIEPTPLIILFELPSSDGCGAPHSAGIHFDKAVEAPVRTNTIPSPKLAKFELNNLV